MATAQGAWVAYDAEGRAIAIFSAEINAWRFAGPQKLDVAQWPFGMPIDEAIAAAKAGA